MLGDNISTEARSKIMSKILGKWTAQERVFYKEHPSAIPHPKFPFHPDFLLNGNAIFLDSNFWHCVGITTKQYERLPQYWQNKLFRNLLRDICADTFYRRFSLRIPEPIWKIHLKEVEQA